MMRLKTMQVYEDVRDYVRSKGLEDKLFTWRTLKEQLFVENNVCNKWIMTVV